MSNQPSPKRSLEGGSYHSWTGTQLKSHAHGTPLDPQYSHPSCGFRAVLNLRHTKEATPR
jgi:hypothetical protein